MHETAPLTGAEELASSFSSQASRSSRLSLAVVTYRFVLLAKQGARGSASSLAAPPPVTTRLTLVVLTTDWRVGAGPVLGPSALEGFAGCERCSQVAAPD